MKNISIRNKVAGLLLVLGLMITPVALVPSTDTVAKCTGGTSCITDGSKKTGLTGTPSVEDTIKNITNVLLFLIGAVSVIMLIIGGFKYVTSNGNADQIKSAKNTIMYAIIGIVVAITAYAIVDWLVGALAPVEES